MKTPVELKSILETHERPFLVIDRNYRIVGANSAFMEAYRVKDAAVLGKQCYQVSHGNDRPCHEYGEECPLRHVQETQQSHSCLHIHQDGDARVHQVRVTMHPIQGSNGEWFGGEIFDELSVLDERRVDQVCMVGASPVFLQALEQLKSAAKYDAPVLLQGETGTGKELAATFIHENSSRREKPFLTLDCTVLTEALFESEVFGHERGAFTGSVGDKKGLFELADSGSLFLDEVGEMSPSTQAKMLRVLESGEFRRLGGHKTHRADARIICATNRDLKQAEWFRKDLFYRVACLSIRLPSLRERIEDVPLLARTLLERIGHSTTVSYQLTKPALRLLQAYHYPGNIRELRNILWAAATKSSDGRIDAEHLQLAEPFRAGIAQTAVTMVRSSDTGNAMSADSPATAAQSRLEDVEADYIARLLADCAGNRRQAAQQLGISERTLYRKLKRLHLR